MVRDKIRKAKGCLHSNIIRDMKDDKNSLGFIVGFFFALFCFTSMRQGS